MSYTTARALYSKTPASRQQRRLAQPAPLNMGGVGETFKSKVPYRMQPYR